MNNDTTNFARPSTSHVVRPSWIAAMKRVVSLGVVVTGVIASIATSPSAPVPAVSGFRALTPFSLAGDESVAHQAIVQLNPETFVDNEGGMLSTMLSASISCTPDDSGVCADVSLGVSVLVTLVELDERGDVVDVAKFATLSSTVTSTAIAITDRSTSIDTRRATYAFEIRRSDGVEVEIPLTARVSSSLYYFGDTEAPDGASMVIGFDDVPAEFVFPAFQALDDGGVVDDDAGISVDGGIDDGDGGVVDAD